MKFKDDFKREMVRKLLLPGGKGAKALSLEIGVNPQTLYNWRDKFSNGSSGNPSTGLKAWGAKAIGVLEYARLPDTEKGEWLRKNGFKSEQLAVWEKEVITMSETTNLRDELKALKIENKKQAKEILKKDKALAELSAIVILQKKTASIFAEERES